MQVEAFFATSHPDEPVVNQCDSHSSPAQRQLVGRIRLAAPCAPRRTRGRAIEAPPDQFFARTWSESGRLLYRAPPARRATDSARNEYSGVRRPPRAARPPRRGHDRQRRRPSPRAPAARSPPGATRPRPPRRPDRRGRARAPRARRAATRPWLEPGSRGSAVAPARGPSRARPGRAAGPSMPRTAASSRSRPLCGEPVGHVQDVGRPERAGAREAATTPGRSGSSAPPEPRRRPRSGSPGCARAGSPRGSTRSRATASEGVSTRRARRRTSREHARSRAACERLRGRRQWIRSWTVTTTGQRTPARQHVVRHVQQVEPAPRDPRDLEVLGERVAAARAPARPRTRGGERRDRGRGPRRGRQHDQTVRPGASAGSRRSSSST